MTFPTSRQPSPDPSITPDSFQPVEPAALPKTESPQHRLPGWRLWVPLLIQAGLIMAVPAQDAYTYAVGTPVTLQTAPVDPYDFLRGYYQTLSYEISQPPTLQNLSGGDLLTSQSYRSEPRPFYVVLEAPDTETSPPAPWQPVRISEVRPTDLAANQVALAGWYDGWQVTYGLERYYMPEDQRTEINADINQTQWQNQEAFVVDVKVDTQGNSVPVGLWVSDRSYRF